MIRLMTVTLASTMILSAHGAAGDQPRPLELGAAVTYTAPSCRSANRAIRYYRHAYRAHREAMGLPGTLPRRRWWGCVSARHRAVGWRTKAHAARVAYRAWWRHEYAWWVWMPRGSKEYRVASCETGYGGDPNWAHDSGRYVSAFGIYRPAYADDAHRVGNLSWDETVRRLGRIPSPREQYEAMMSHRAQHGGWSGWGCRGA